MRTMVRLPLPWAAFALACSVLAGEAADDLKVQATGLRLVAPAVSADESVRAFNWSTADWSSGTTVALLVSRPGGGLVQFDANGSSLAKFADDKGTDLLAKPASDPAAADGGKRKLVPAGFSLFPRVSQDGKFCAVELRGPALPARGASRLRLEGVIAMLCASRKAEFVQKDVALRNSSRITAANVELSICEAGKPETGVEPLGLTLRSYKELHEVAEIRFYKPDGTEIKSRRTGTSTLGVLGALTVDWSFSLAEKVDAATVKVFLWADLQKKQVPFALDIDVGSF
ncbi:MAG: hypothetical protein NTW87_07760 [Planctomycetota bacterium]|nr:hypothetical protein [Planctomycetota bacterium]